MAGNIEEILFSSEAARSLLMEKRVADKIRAAHWDAKTGIYYKDSDTKKLREMDVFGVQAFDKPRKSDGMGAPVINLYLNCECKSLSGSNVLLLPGEITDPLQISGMPFWLGWELERVVTNIAEQARITDLRKIKRLHDYVTGRAFVGSIAAVKRGVSMPRPPVDIIAWSFRETRGGEHEDDSSGNRNQPTPVWNAIRAATDAALAVRRKAIETSLDWVYGLDLKFYGTGKFAHFAAFSLDAELFRNVFFHSFVVLDARLWRANPNDISEVKSARLYLSDIDHDNNYVDMVNSKFLDEYIDAMVKHYLKFSRRSISKQWALMKEIGWEPGQDERKLLAILRSKNRKGRRAAAQL